MKIEWLRRNERIFLWLLILFWSATPGQAATVTKLQKNQQVVIDEGTDSGFAKGAEVCFFKDTTKKIGCGTVVKSKAKAALVKVEDAAVLKKIKKGDTANLEGGADKSAAGGGSKKAPYRFAVRGLGSLYPMNPAKFNTVAFAAPASPTTKVDSAWQVVESRGFAVGGGAEVEMTLSKSMAVALGFRMATMCKLKGGLYCKFEAPADYVANDATKYNLYVNTIQSGKDLGLWADVYFLSVPLGKTTSLRLAAGLDIDMSTMTLVASRLDSDGKEADFDLAVLTSKKNIISLRLVPDLNMFFGGFGMSLGARVYLPLVASGKASGSADDKLTAIVNGDPIEDLTKVVNHNKSSIGLELLLAAYFGF